MEENSVINVVESEDVGTGSSGECAPSITSDCLSEQEEYSSASDSGKGGSDLTPPDSLTAAEVPVTQWHLCPPYSSYTAYSDSLGKVLPNHAMIYEFEIPQAIVGRLIGRYGAFVNKIKVTAGANIIVKRHHLGAGRKICAVEGVCSEIDKAIGMIRERFPSKRFPHLTLEQVNPSTDRIPASISFLPSNNKLNLTEGVVNDVTLSCIVSLDHIFVQQPTHPTYPALSRLHEALKSLYDLPVGAPKLSRPFNPGVICVAHINDDEWVRAEVVAVEDEQAQATARLVDIGGYVDVPIESLRQIRVDFVTIPFQATECRLANLSPINEEEGWSEEAINFFKLLCQGQILQTNVVGYSPKDGVTLIHLYKLNETHSHIFINEEVVKNGYAKWIDEAEYFISEDYADGIPELTEAFDSVGLGTDELSSEETDASSARSDDAHQVDIEISLNATHDVKVSDSTHPILVSQ